ncbi:hypothetical protein FCV25MIE_22347, partial [Fagus crenata]
TTDFLGNYQLHLRNPESAVGVAFGVELFTAAAFPIRLINIYLCRHSPISNKISPI